MKKQVGLIGYGRFGKVLADLLLKKYELKIFDTKTANNYEEIKASSLESFKKSTG